MNPSTLSSERRSGNTPTTAPPYRLLHVITSMDPRQGGPPEGIRQLSKTLVEQGHSIEVACLDAPGGCGPDDRSLKIHRLGPAIGKYCYSRSFVPWLRANADRFDCVIAHDLWQYPCRAVWRALGRTKTPYFVFAHGMLDPWFRRTYPLKHLKKSAYWRVAGYRILRDARAVFFTSEQEKHLASQSFRPYQCRGVTVGFGSTGAPSSAVELRNAFLDAFPGLQGQKLLLYLGRLDPKKGLDILIEAFAQSLGGDEQTQLVIAGPDNLDLRRSLEWRASNLGMSARITWTGLLTDEQKWGALYASELFCLASHQENFALGVAEALSCGLPVLISDKVNIYREVEADRAGFVSADDVAGIAQSLKCWMGLTPLERAAMRASARRSFDRNFKIETAARNLVEAIRIHGMVGQNARKEPPITGMIP